MKNLTVCLALGAAVSSWGQVNLTTNNYSQNFDTLAQSPLSNTWSNNTTLAGWYSTENNYFADDGNNAAILGLFSFGSTGSSERALGSHRPGTTLSIQYGAELRNLTGSTINSLFLSYRGEQWAGGGLTAGPESLLFDYSTSATTLGTGTWTSVGALDFVSPQPFSITNAMGNNLGFFTTQSTTLTGLNWTQGTDLWIRWTHQQPMIHGLAIDDFVLQANPVPEPFTLGLALAGLGLASRRRLLRAKP